MTQLDKSRLRRIRIPEHFYEKNLDSFIPTTHEQVAHLFWARQFAIDVANNSPKSSLLLGDMGLGKTHLACGIAVAVAERIGTLFCEATVEHFERVVYTTVDDAVTRVKNSWNSRTTSEGEIRDSLTKPRLLILDEAGDRGLGLRAQPALQHHGHPLRDAEANGRRREQGPGRHNRVPRGARHGPAARVRRRGPVLQGREPPRDDGGSMSTHTPGPWYADAYVVATVPAWKGPDDGTVVCQTCHPWTTASVTEREANARLIAAAPDMLAALEEIMLDGVMLSYGTEGCWFCRSCRDENHASDCEGVRLLANAKGGES